MTLRALVQKNQNKALEAALKKQYSIMQNVLLDLSRKNGETVVPVAYDYTDFINTFVQSLDYYKYCRTGGCTSISLDM